ncbi:MAG: beta-galactosidase trimerization domain-containing protein [Gemmatales bacterium]|nr:beta-galactosidase trimerization domain-containing protein [Gemmatales bacterium]
MYPYKMVVICLPLGLLGAVVAQLPIPKLGVPQAEALPTLQLRARVLAWKGNQPMQRKFTIHVTGVKQVAIATDDHWSPWITIDKESWHAILKSYPNSYHRRYPVVFQINYHPHDQDIQVAVEVRSPAGKNLLSQEAHLFGSRLSLLLFRDERGEFQVATEADYNRRYWQAFSGARQQSSPKLKHLIVVDRYIGGDDDYRAWQEGISELARAGFTAIMVPPSKHIRNILTKTGTTKTSWAVYNPPGYAFAFDPKITPESIDAWARQLADSYTKAGFAPTDMILFAMSDEPGWYYPSMFKVVKENPQALEKFRAYLRNQGLDPQSFNAKSWEDIYPLGRSQAQDLASRKLFYWTMRFYSWESARHFSDCVRALEKVFYPNIPVFTNWNFFAGRFYVPGPVANNPDKNHPDAAMGGHDWFEFARLRGGTILWTEDWFSDAQAYQWSFYCSKLRSAAAKSNLLFGGYVVPRTAGDRPDGLMQKILCIFGHGGKAVKYFVFGPEYNFPGNCYSEKAHLLSKLRETHNLLVAAEEYLYPGKMPPSPVAILMPRSAQVWDCKDMPIAQGISDATNTNLNRATVDYMAEVFDIYLALQHANIAVDFIDEDDLTTKGLSNYRVIYVTEPNVPREGLEALISWMRNGGTLVTITNAATADRYDEPCSLLGDATGVKEKARTRLLIANANQLPQAGILDTDKEQIAVYGARGELEPGDYKVLLRFTNKTPAVVEKAVEQGRLVHYAFLPGISYWRSSKGTRDRLPVDFSETLRTWICYPVLSIGIRPFVAPSTPLVETPILISEKGAALTLLNWTGEPIHDLTLEVRLPFAVTSVSSVSGRKIKWVRNNDCYSITLPLGSADILLLERQR